MQYRTYRSYINGLEEKIVGEAHMLIAGASGSGKSVLIRRVLRACCTFGYDMVLIDPKDVELRPWRNCVNCLGYADSTMPGSMENLLRWVCDEMDRRYALMANDEWCVMWKGPHMWVVVDEYADLLLSSRNKNDIKRLCMRIAQKGRAAGIHLLLATQRPTRDIVDGGIKVNMCARIALHCPTAQDSRNIINYNGAESLPYVGQCYYLEESGEVNRYIVPMMTTEEAKACVDFMASQNPRLQTTWKQRRALKKMRKAWGLR